MDSATVLQSEDLFSRTITNFFLGFAILLFLYHFLFRSTRLAELGNKIPGPTPIPIFGNALLAIRKNPKEILEYAVDMAIKMNKSVLKVWLGPFLYIGILHPDDIEVILGSQVHLEKSNEYKLFEPWLGDGLLISKGDKWRRHRKLIAPTFHQAILKTFVPIFNKNANQLIDTLKDEIGKEFDVHDYMSGTTVDVLLETAMGVKKTDADNTGFKYAKAVMEQCNILHLRHYKFWLRPDFIFRLTKMGGMQKKFLNIIHTLSNSVIARKKTEFEIRKKSGETSLYSEVKQTTENYDTGILNDDYIKDDLDEIDKDIGQRKRLAFLDFIIEASKIDNCLTDEEIRDQVNTIMFEGHDTTAAASSFALCLLGVHHDIQDKVLKELASIFGNSDRDITFNDTLEMHYLERVIKETLRLYPPVPIIARKINEDTYIPSGYVLPAGSTVVVGTLLTHRNPEIYPNPKQFNPDNFLPEACKKRHYYSFIPFSAGPRSCVGRKYAMLKLKVILAKVLRKYRVISTVDEDKFELQGDIILKRSDGFKLRIEEREKTSI